MHLDPLIVLLGPTASGKTALAVQLANAIDGEIISADSRQVYTGMDIGTGKDIAVYKVNEKQIKYHLIDVLPAGDKYSVHRFKQDFSRAYLDIRSRGKFPILCGGTGLYIQQILQPEPYTSVPLNVKLREKLGALDKDALVKRLENIGDFGMRVDRSSIKRLIRAIEIGEYLQTNEFVIPEVTKYDALVFGLRLERPVLRSRIYDRLQQRLQGGLVEEAIALMDNNVSTEMLEYYGLEYRFLAAYLGGHMTRPDMEERLFNAIAQYAKRQETFFKKMQKDGISIHWLDGHEPSNVLKRTLLNSCYQHFDGLIKT